MKYQFWLASLEEVTSSQKLKLLELCGSEEAIFRLPQYRLDKLHTIPQKARAAISAAQKNQSWEQEWENFRQQTVKLICFHSEAYPEKLRNIYNPPYCLYVKGSLPPQEQKLAAIVGARACSPYGQAVAKQIGKELAEQGIGVVSGLAYGIDGAAHQGTIEGGGAAYAVLGSGVDVCYPARNRKLYQEAVRCGGVISENKMGCAPLPHLFPQRNRIISALSDAVIVVEAKKKSGSLITADFALEQGKQVYAVPGRISDRLSDGTNWLISQGAALFYSTEEFLKDMGLFREEKKKLIQFALEKNERLVYSVLDLTPKHLEEIIGQTGLDFKEALESLFCLEKHGYIKEIYKNHYIRDGL